MVYLFLLGWVISQTMLSKIWVICSYASYSSINLFFLALVDEKPKDVRTTLEEMKTDMLQKIEDSV